MKKKNQTNQDKYTSLSNFWQMGTYLPTNLSSPIAAALDKLKQEIGCVDSYVTNKLGYSIRKAEQYLSAEQIDAIALALWNLERGEGCIIGDQCVAGHTRIFDPILNTHTPIKELAERGNPIHVLALSTDGLVPARASCPFLKGTADLYRVVLDDNREITVTAQHRFLTPFGWRSLSDGLREGHFLSSAEDLPAYNLGFFLSTLHEDDLHLKNKAQDLLNHCFAYSCLCDEQLLLDRDTSQEIVPLLGDALEHTPLLSRLDDQEILLKRIHQHQPICHHSKSNFCPIWSHDLLLNCTHEISSPLSALGKILQNALLFDDVSLRLLPESSLALEDLHMDDVEYSSLNDFLFLHPQEKGIFDKDTKKVLPPERSWAKNCPLNTKDVLSLQYQETKKYNKAVSYGDYAGWRRIKSITFVECAEFYDLHVPVHENYVAEGIINHNTGIGKGRMAAAVMRYAIRQGLIPIFITDNTKLYRDIVRDMWDINTTGIQPLLTDAGVSIELPDGTFYKTRTGPAHSRLLKEITEKDCLGDYNAIFCTYHQLKTVGNYKLRREFLDRFIDRAILVMDESHVAGGSATGLPRFAKASDKELPPNMAEYARALVSQAKGLVCLSATYAKNSKVLGLYATKTGMRHAVTTEDALSFMVEQGGIPLQQMLAMKLAEAGQYIRRERSYEGVAFLQEVAGVDRSYADAFSQIMRAIAEFDKLKEPSVAMLDDMVAGEGKKVHEAGKKDVGGVTSVNFTSIMWNVINQFLLSVKVDKVSDYAIASLKQGEKVVIALSNTMGSFISAYAEENLLEPGDPIDINVVDLLLKYLRRSREVTIKDPEREPVRRYLEDDELSVEALAHYNGTRQLIEALRETMGNCPLSPIDWMIYRLSKAGYRIDEITGRSDRIKYSDDVAIYERRSASDKTPTANNRKIAAFNNGDIDVLILNRSASTGVSLHASEKFGDRRKRHMVIAQPDLNIDQVMQMLGRVHRTGQVVLPKFTFFSSDLPAERRPGAILMKKMNSLSANTTANKNSDVDLNELDMLNQYGDRVVVEYLQDNPDINSALLEPIDIGESVIEEDEEADKDADKDAMRKVSGRIALLPIEKQEQFYQEIESRLNATIEMAKNRGTYSLEAEFSKLDATPIRKLEAIPAKPVDSPFAESCILWQMEVNSGRLPKNSTEVRDAVCEFYSLAKFASWEKIEETAKKWQTENMETFKAEAKEAYEKQLDKLKASEALSVQAYSNALDRIHGLGCSEEDRNKKLGKLEALHQSTINKHREERAALNQRFNSHYKSITWVFERILVGSPIIATVEFAGEETKHEGVIVGIKRNRAFSNPCNARAWTLLIEFASQLRSLSIQFSELNNWVKICNIFPLKDIKKSYEIFDLHQIPAREIREIFMGNLLGAYEAFPKGRFISFNTNDGKIEQGLLMPKGFSIIEALKERPVRFDDVDAAVSFMSLTRAHLHTKDRKLEMYMSGGSLQIALQGQSKQYKLYWANRKLLAALDQEFVTGQNKIMIARTYRAEEAIAAVMEICSIEALKELEQARTAVGIGKIEFENPANLVEMANYNRDHLKVVGGKP